MSVCPGNLLSKVHCQLYLTADMREIVTTRTNSAQTRIAKTSIAPEKILVAASTNRGSPCELKSE